MTREWFDRPDPIGTTRRGEIGLRFSCTQCGNCCTGPTGYVLFTPEEAGRMAAALGVDTETFTTTYTRETDLGRSLREVRTPRGYDCVFLERDGSGLARCRIYQARPGQCRTWPFWKSNLRDRGAWERAARTCPGINRGPLTGPDAIRLTRDRVEI